MPSPRASGDDGSGLKSEDRPGMTEAKEDMGFGKKVALITLASAGVALFVTGRTAKALTKRINPTNAALRPAVADPQSLSIFSPLSAFRFLAADQANQVPLAARQNLPADWRGAAAAGPPRPGELKRLWARDFRDNRTLCRETELASTSARSISEDGKPLGFNPALDALAALGLASVLVVLGAYGVIRHLGAKWQLEGFEDWTMFVRYALKRRVVAEGWTERMKVLVPDQVKRKEPNQRDTEAESEESVEAVRNWAKEMDEEWEVEVKRRKVELKGWNDDRRRRGLPILVEG